MVKLFASTRAIAPFLKNNNPSLHYRKKWESKSMSWYEFRNHVSYSTIDPDMVFYDEIDSNAVTTKAIDGTSFEVYGLVGSEKVYRIGV